MVRSLWETVWKFLKRKLRLELPYEGTILLLGITEAKSETIAYRVNRGCLQ